jgi:hypothetical protein
MDYNASYRAPSLQSTLFFPDQVGLASKRDSLNIVEQRRRLVKGGAFAYLRFPNPLP